MSDDRNNELLTEANKQMDIVPYTRKDRIVTYLILIIVFANFVTITLNVLGVGF